MEAPAERAPPVRTRRFTAATTNGTPTSLSLSMTSSFPVHHTAHMSACAATGRTSRNLDPSQQPPLLRRLSPSYTRSPYASPVTAHKGAATSSSAPLDDASCLPLDVLEPAAARWALTADRGSRRAPRVRSSLGPQSEVVDTGLFVCPNTVVAALYSAAPGRGHLVMTAESGGWLRVREQKTGAIRHQRQLRDGGEVSCLAWASAGGDTAVEPLGAVVVAGQLSGLISFYALVGESLVELPSATCVFHEAPLLSCLPLRAPASAEEPAATAPGALVNVLLSLDADGVVALWSLQLTEVGGGADRGNEADLRLSALLLDCRYASLSPTSSFPPVVMAAMGLSCVSTSTCCVLSTHRFVQQPLSPTGVPSDGDEEADTQGSAVVFLSSFTVSLTADPNATMLSINTGASTGLEEGAPAPDSAQPPLRRDWKVLRAYRVPVGLLPQRGDEGSSTSVNSAVVAITALCVTGCISHSSSAASAEQLWAGTADGRLLIWEAHTGRFVRSLHSASAAPVHSLTSVPSPGSPGQALVWASQADGSVMAWSADTYTVAEVLPVSYPPSGPVVSRTGDAEDSVGGDPANAVVTVRDAVDLLRATRHRCAPSTLRAPRRRGCGFTLFVKPMELVCMQRAWSVGTDGTVRTWLLPSGRASAGGAVADTAGAAVASWPTSDTGGAARAASLDAHTVQCYLQDRADALARERQAQRLASEAQQEQLQILQERNRVLAAALQQAIRRLEQVSVDDLVRSASRPCSSPSVAPLQNEDGADAALVESAVLAPGSPTTTSTTTLSAVSEADEQPVVAAQPSTIVVTPDATSPPLPAMTTLPPAAQMHVQALQQLLEELHAKLEESWSRNDALREELLECQLRMLGREEDIAQSALMTAADEVAAAAATGNAEGQTSAAHGVTAATATTSAPSPVLPSAHIATSSLSGSTNGSYTQEEGRAHSDRLQTSPPPQTRHAPCTALTASADNSFPSRAFCSPSVEELAPWAVAQARPLTPPPPPEMRSTEDASYPLSVKPQATPPSPTEVSPSTSTAAERFFKAASAMLRTSTITYGDVARREPSVAGRAHVPTPPLLSETEEEDVYAEEGDYTDGDDDEIALLEAWCTSEGDLSPIPGPDPVAARGATSTDASVVRGGRGEPFPSPLSLFMSTSFSAGHATGGSGSAIDRPGALRVAWPPTHVTATWTTPARAAGRDDPVVDNARGRVLTAPSRRSGSLAAGSARPAAVGTGVVQSAPMQGAGTTPSAASPPYAFRSPIIYRPA
nr:unnamed protein product [Leishmania braziliensis]